MSLRFVFVAFLIQAHGTKSARHLGQSVENDPNVWQSRESFRIEIAVSRYPFMARRHFREGQPGSIRRGRRGLPGLRRNSSPEVELNTWSLTPISMTPISEENDDAGIPLRFGVPGSWPDPW